MLYSSERSFPSASFATVQASSDNAIDSLFTDCKQCHYIIIPFHLERVVSMFRLITNTEPSQSIRSVKSNGWQNTSTVLRFYGTTASAIRTTKPECSISVQRFNSNHVERAFVFRSIRPGCSYFGERLYESKQFQPLLSITEMQSLVR